MKIAGLWKVVREHGIDSIALLLAGSAIAVLGIFGVASLKITISVTLAMLSAVAALLLRSDSRETRFEDMAGELSDQLHQLQNAIAGSDEAASSFRFEYPDLSVLIERSACVDVIAGLALNVVNQYHGKWREGLERGLKVRFLCPDPDNEAVVELALFRSVFRKTSADVSDDVRAQIQFAKSMDDAGGSLTIATIPYLPPFGIVKFSGPGIDDVMFVKLMSFKVGAGQYPVLKLTRGFSEQWFSYFDDQIAGYFNVATEIHP